MKKSFFIKMILIICVLTIFIGVIWHPCNSFASSSIIDPDDYRVDGKNVQNADIVMNIGNDIIGFIRIIGTILSVLVLVVIGIKYMIGSVEERAEYKKSMWPYVLGAVLVFSITNILGIIIDIAGSLF